MGRYLPKRNFLPWSCQEIEKRILKVVDTIIKTFCIFVFKIYYDFFDILFKIYSPIASLNYCVITSLCSSPFQAIINDSYLLIHIHILIHIHQSTIMLVAMVTLNNSVPFPCTKVKSHPVIVHLSPTRKALKSLVFKMAGSAGQVQASMDRTICMARRPTVVMVREGRGLTMCIPSMVSY